MQHHIAPGGVGARPHQRGARLGVGVGRLEGTDQAHHEQEPGAEHHDEDRRRATDPVVDVGAWRGCGRAGRRARRRLPPGGSGPGGVGIIRASGAPRAARRCPADPILPAGAGPVRSPDRRAADRLRGTGPSAPSCAGPARCRGRAGRGGVGVGAAPRRAGGGRRAPPRDHAGVQQGVPGPSDGDGARPHRPGAPGPLRVPRDRRERRALDAVVAVATDAGVPAEGAGVWRAGSSVLVGLPAVPAVGRVDAPERAGDAERQVVVAAVLGQRGRARHRAGDPLPGGGGDTGRAGHDLAVRGGRRPRAGPGGVGAGRAPPPRRHPRRRRPGSGPRPVGRVGGRARPGPRRRVARPRTTSPSCGGWPGARPAAGPDGTTTRWVLRSCTVISTGGT